MNILVAANAFKGTLTSREVNQIIKDYLEKMNHQVTSVEMSDGGDGFLDVISSAIEGHFVYVETYNPLHDVIEVPYYMTKDAAYIELAKVVGLELIEEGRRNPLKTSTYGLGVLIKQAISQDVKRIYIGLGGSATNDGGAGMLQALGVKFYHKSQLLDQPLNGDTIGEITSIDTSELEDLIQSIDFELICDVDNPLLGKYGASQVYASQKGASQADIYVLDKHMEHYAHVIEDKFKRDFKHYRGSGAAGGVGFGCLATLGAKMYQGVSFMIDLLSIEQKIKTADVVIVSEGKLDQQTLHGKAPYGIAKLAKKYGKKVIGIFALKSDDAKMDFLDEIYVIVPKFANMRTSTKNPKNCLKKVLKSITFN